MKRTALAAVTAAGMLAALAVTGCTDSSTSGGDTFTVVGDASIDVNAPINPYNQSTNAFEGYNSMHLGWQKNSLTDANAFYPGLAKSWSLSANGLDLTIHLQPNAKWSDGSPVTAKDVQTSAAVSFTQGGGAFAVSPGAAGGLGAVKVINKSTIEFDQAAGSANNTFEGNILNLAVVSTKQWGPQLPADVWTLIKTATDPKAAKAAQSAAQTKLQNLGKKLVDFNPKTDLSAGPFVLKQVTKSEAVLTKNKYFYDAGKIGPSQVVMKAYSGNEQIWNYLIAGQLDASVYTSTPANVLAKIKKTAGNTTISGSSPVAASLAFNQTYKPFDNVHVRRAFGYYIDRKLTTKIGESTSGTAAQTTTGLISSAAKAWIGQGAMNKLNQYPLDKSKGDAELAAAGLTKVGGKWQYKGKPFSVTIEAAGGFTDWIAAAGSVANQLKADGIDAQVKTAADYATYLTDIAAGKYELGFWLTALGPSTYNAFARLYGPSNGWNQFGAQVRHSPAGKNGNWMAGATTATVPGLGTVNPGVLTNDLSQQSQADQKATVLKLVQYTNDQLPAIQLWDYTNLQYINTSRWTNWPANNSDVLRLPQGVWMQLGYIQKK